VIRDILMQELGTHDTVFNDPSQGAMGINTPRNDKDYDKPDYTRHIFTTIYDDVFIRSSSGIVTSVRRKQTLRGEIPINKKLGTIDNGVYIVETFRMYDITTVKLAALLAYYESVPETTDGITNTMRSMVRSKIGAYDTYSLRVITFIPESELLDKRQVHVPAINATLLYSTVPAYNNLGANNNIDTDNVINSNIIKVDVVDHNPAHKYYCALGINSIPLVVNNNTTLPEGVKVTTTLGEVNKTYNMPLDKQVLINYGISDSPTAKSAVELATINKEIMHDQLKTRELSAKTTALVLNNADGLSQRMHNQKMRALDAVIANHNANSSIQTAAINLATKTVGLNTAIVAASKQDNNTDSTVKTIGSVMGIIAKYIPK